MSIDIPLDHFIPDRTSAPTQAAAAKRKQAKK